MVIAASERREKEDVLRAGEEISRWLNGLHIRFCCEALARPLHILEVWTSGIGARRWSRRANPCLFSGSALSFFLRLWSFYSELSSSSFSKESLSSRLTHGSGILVPDAGNPCLTCWSSIITGEASIPIINSLERTIREGRPQASQSKKEELKSTNA